MQTKTQLLQPPAQDATAAPATPATETPAIATTQPLPPATEAPAVATTQPAAPAAAPAAVATTQPAAPAAAVATTQPATAAPVTEAATTTTQPPAPTEAAPVATHPPPPATQAPPVVTTQPPPPHAPSQPPAVEHPPAPIRLPPPPACRGDGRFDQNDACNFNPSWSGCVHSPGCNWNGQSYFGGWCEGGPRCVYLPSQAICLGVNAGCYWQAATAPLNWAEGDAEAAHAAQVAAAAWSAAASAAQAARENSNCFGDGSLSQNLGCPYHVLWGTCVVTAGCNWHGESALGGWCTGGTQCTYQPVPTGCMVTPGCRWQPATAPLMVPM